MPTDRSPSPPEPAPSAAPGRKNQWPSPDVLNGLVLGFGLAALEEDALLRDGGRAALRPLAMQPELVRRDREAMVLVHGILGAPVDLQPVVDRHWRPGPEARQLHVLCYDDYGRRTGANGLDLADELRALADWMHPDARGERRLTIVAHSLGGIVARRALAALCRDGGIERFDRVRCVCVDTPWHGYDGPADRGAGRFLMSVVRPLLPDGLEDMRAGSALFRGDPDAALPSERAPLFGALDERAALHLVFAERGDDVVDYSEPLFAALPGHLACWFNDDAPVRDEPRVMNHLAALRDGDAWPAFSHELSGRAARERLDARDVLDALLRHFPRFPGDHASVLSEHPGRRSFLDHLDEHLAREP